MLREMITKYIDALPYSTSYVASDNQSMFFLKNTDRGRTLHALDLLTSHSPLTAREICDVDFSQQAFIPIDFDGRSGTFFLISDDANTENFNVYSVALNGPDAGKLHRITHSACCSQARFFQNFSQLLYVDRYSTAAGRLSSQLMLRDLASGRERMILDDKGWSYRLAWGKIGLSPDGLQAVLTVDYENRRQALNLIMVDLNSGSIETLLPRGQESASVYCEEQGHDGSSFFYQSDRSGFSALYRFDLRERKSVEILAPKARTRGLGIKKDNDRLIAVALAPRDEQDQTEIIVRELADESAARSFFLTGSYCLEQGEHGAWLTESRIDSPLRRIEPNFSNNSYRERRSVTLATGNIATLVHSTYRYIKYSSFDGLTIPAYLIIPKGEIKAAVITAFYGGTNRYDPAVQMLAELGIASLSPAVRGSWGRGKSWENMLKGDLGGNEILDVIWGARYLETELGLSPRQIGLQGESHGGYAVLRAVTMPEGFNGQTSKYKFGFAICWAGFADLVEFHEASRIPDWLTDLLGPINEKRDTYIDRSPITHFRELETPLLITHGENDTRVPLSTMQSFIEALSRSTVPHDVHIQKGGGHTTPSRQELIDSYVRELEFVRKYGVAAAYAATDSLTD